jgi:hypothetical protein
VRGTDSGLKMLSCSKCCSAAIGAILTWPPKSRAISAAGPSANERETCARPRRPRRNPARRISATDPRRRAVATAEDYSVIVRCHSGSGANAPSRNDGLRIASRSLSSGARSRDPLARNDGPPPYSDLSIFQNTGVAGPPSTPVSDFRHALGAMYCPSGI